MTHTVVPRDTRREGNACMQGREEGREGGREEGRKGGREGGRKGRREG